MESALFLIEGWRERLGILLRGRQPVMCIPARSVVGMHIKPELVPATPDTGIRRLTL